jgi:hypothetical protein
VKAKGLRVRGFKRSPLWIALAVALTTPARAHVPVLRGKLVDLVQRSDAIMIGTAERVQPAAGRLVDTQIRVEQRLVGSTHETTLIFRGRTHFVPGGRYVFFLVQARSGWEATPEAGTVFPARAEDDAAYRTAVVAIRVALHGDPTARVAALWAALLPALSAAAPPLRYHAALELEALSRAGHGPTDNARQTLTKLLSDPSTDPALQPLLSSALQQPTP